jgi:hypothetical protein
VATAAALVVTPSPARANGRFPASSQLLVSPSNPSLVVLRTTFGLLFSFDAGGSWHWLCELAIGYGNAQEDPFLGITQSGSLVAGLPTGLSVSLDTGCDWAFVRGALDRQLIKDVAVRPDNPHAVVALTSTFTPSDAGATDGGLGGGYYAQVFQSTDDGATWSPLGVPLDPSMLPTTLDVAASDPHRLYVAGFRGQGMGRTASLFVSTDDGAHWTEHPAPLDPTTETALYIAAVDPIDADRVYLRSTGQSRLVMTSDAGGSFRIPLVLHGEMLGFAVSPDGSKVYAGSREDGLFLATRDSLTLARPHGAPPPFTQRSTIRVQCLTAHGADLWACSDEPSGFVAGVSSDDGATFAPKLHLTGIDGVLACGADAGSRQCDSLYPPLCDNLGGCATGDAGPADAAAGADASPPGAEPQPPPAATSCGCRIIGGGGAAGAAVAAVLAAAAAALRRRNRR